MSVYLELLILALVVCWLVDLSGATESLLAALSRFTARYGRAPVRSLRPFTCSLCMVWWCGLAWLLVRGCFTLPCVAVVAGLAHFSRTFTQMLLFIREATLRIVSLLFRWIEQD